MSDTIQPRQYYSARKHGSSPRRLSLEELRGLLLSDFEHYEHSGYFVEAFGSYCVDTGFEPGFAGSNIDAYVTLKLERDDLWPIRDYHEDFDEDDVFTIVEFLYDHISKPRHKSYHAWSNCGYHYSDFDRREGRKEFRERINLPLRRYGQGWELNESGDIMSLPPEGMESLLSAPQPTAEPTIRQKIEAATMKFRRHGNSQTDRHHAVRDLADVLEFVRPQLKETLLPDDERDLFNIANNFGIRHLNQRQKLNYDQDAWLTWMFYHYLNTIHTFLQLAKRQD